MVSVTAVMTAMAVRHDDAARQERGGSDEGNGQGQSFHEATPGCKMQPPALNRLAPRLDDGVTESYSLGVDILQASHP